MNKLVVAASRLAVRQNVPGFRAVAVPAIRVTPVAVQVRSMSLLGDKLESFATSKAGDIRGLDEFPLIVLVHFMTWFFR
jgi:hypothetical protein